MQFAVPRRHSDQRVEQERERREIAHRAMPDSRTERPGVIARAVIVPEAAPTSTRSLTLFHPINPYKSRCVVRGSARILQISKTMPCFSKSQKQCHAFQMLSVKNAERIKNTPLKSVSFNRTMVFTCIECITFIEFIAFVVFVRFAIRMQYLLRDQRLPEVEQ